MKLQVPKVLSALPGRCVDRRSLFLPYRRKWRTASLAALIAIGMGASGLVFVDQSSGLPDGVAVRIGDQDVTKQEMNHRMQVLKALYGIQQPVSQRGQDGFRRSLAKTVALSKILERGARARNISISEESARTTLNEMVTRQLPGGREAFINLLREYGASEQDILDEIMRQQSADILFHQVGTGVAGQVTDDSVLKYFNDHRETMLTPEQRSTQNVVVASEDQAREVLARARSGGDFSGLVKEFSLDESTKKSDGVLGMVEKPQLERSYGDQAFAVPVGSVFGPVRTSRGWNIGRVVDVKPAHPLQFHEMKDRLRTQLSLEKGSEMWRNWIVSEMQSAHIKYAAEYRPADSDSLPPRVSMRPQGNGAASSGAEGTR